jgi:arylsulfatase A-like enzyme
MAPSPYVSSLRAAVVSGLCAALVVGGLDGALALGRVEESLGASVTLRFILGTLGFAILAALVLALVEGLVAGAIRRTLPVGERLGAVFRAARTDATVDSDAAGAIIAAYVAAGLFAGAVALFHLAVAGGMARRMNAAVATALVAVALVPLTVLAWFPCFRAGRLIARALPRRDGLSRLAVALGLGVVVVTAAAVLVLRSIDWRVIDFGPYLAFAGLLTIQAFVAALLYATRPGAATRRRLPGRALLAVGLVVALLVSGWTLACFEADPRLPDLALRHGSAVKSLLRLSRAVRQGRGLSLAGGDATGAGASAEVDDFAPAPGSAPGRGGPPATSPAAGPRVRPPAGNDVAGPRPATGAFDGNVLIVTIDAVRADRLGISKYRRSITPTIDQLVADGVYFQRAYAQAPNTPRSFPSFVTSLLPSQVKWQKTFANFSPLAPGNPSWFEEAATAGLRTVGIFSHFYFTPERGLGRGFAEWDNAGALSLHDSNTDIAAPRIVPRVIRRLEEAARQKERFLLWTYLFEPHSRYMTHPEFPVKSTGLAGLEEKYDYEIAFADLWLGRLLEALDRTGLASRTLVVVFADHGEGFGEHRHYFHGQSVYEEMIHVPVVFRGPGLRPRTVAEPVALMDLGPTILDLIGVAPRAAFSGRSLAPALRGADLPPRPVVAELLPAPSWDHSARALIDGNWKIVNRASDNLWELYDLARDPREKRNLFFTEKPQAERLKAALLERIGPAGDAGAGAGR